MNFKPLHDRILVKRLEEEIKSQSGIIIPDTAKEKPLEGIVIKVGKGIKDMQGNNQAPELKEGNKILFGKWGGTEVKINGQEYLIMKESDVLGIIN
jgi:chaperonin GroES